MKTIRSKPIDLWVAIDWFKLKKYQEQFELLFNIPAFVDSKRQLNLFINSHDNLIISIYKK